MRPDISDGQVVEVIATWAVVVASRFLYIFCPLVFQFPDHLRPNHLRKSLELPTCGLMRSLQRSARWQLVTLWVILVVAGGAFLGSSDGRPTGRSLFGWKGVTISCNAVTEVLT
jgi:hypothetical protein